MTPPPISLENCPPEIRANPLPFDECVAEQPRTDPALPPPPPRHVPPQFRFRRLSLGHEASFRFLNHSEAEFQFRLGAFALFRPHRMFGIGAQMDTDFVSEIGALGRLQGSFWLDRFGIHKLSVAPLFGVRHLFDQARPLESGGSANVQGSLFVTGLELAWDIQLIRELTLAPYVRTLISPPSEVRLVDAPETAVSISTHVEALAGLRLTYDLFPAP